MYLLAMFRLDFVYVRRIAAFTYLQEYQTATYSPLNGEGETPEKYK